MNALLQDINIVHTYPTIFHIGIPKSSKVIEIDAKDGKNVFYLPKDSDYTAVMSSGGGNDDKKKRQEKERLNEQLILESIGKANRDGLGLSGKVRIMKG